MSVDLFGDLERPAKAAPKKPQPKPSPAPKRSPVTGGYAYGSEGRAIKGSVKEGNVVTLWH